MEVKPKIQLRTGIGKIWAAKSAQSANGRTDTDGGKSAKDGGGTLSGKKVSGTQKRILTDFKKLAADDRIWDTMSLTKVENDKAKDDKAKDDKVKDKDKSLKDKAKDKDKDKDEVESYDLVITPDEGIYKGGKFEFRVVITTEYPFGPPKVTSMKKLYHPNFDLKGKPCLNILREGWMPVMDLHAVLVGMQFLLLEPNPDDPLNKEAAQDMRNNRENFKRNVRTAMAGGFVGGVQFDKVLP